MSKVLYGRSDDLICLENETQIGANHLEKTIVKVEEFKIEGYYNIEKHQWEFTVTKAPSTENYTKLEVQDDMNHPRIPNIQTPTEGIEFFNLPESPTIEKLE